MSSLWLLLDFQPADAASAMPFAAPNALESPSQRGATTTFVDQVPPLPSCTQWPTVIRCFASISVPEQT